MRFCTQCGTGTDDASLKFCINCGSALPAAAAVVAPPVVPAVIAEVPVAPVAPEAPVISEVPAAVIAPVPPAAPAAPPAPDDGFVVRRTRTSPFLPPPVQEDAAPVISRAWAQSQSARPAASKLSKQRKMAGGLPDWEPLPPGEVLVKRGSRTRS